LLAQSDCSGFTSVLGLVGRMLVRFGIGRFHRIGNVFIVFLSALSLDATAKATR
jgi:hypothetical protein